MTNNLSPFEYILVTFDDCKIKIQVFFYAGGSSKTINTHKTHDFDR